MGKRIALEPHAADIITYMNDESISIDQCIITDHNFNVNQLIDGQVDAITAYITDEPFLLNENGFDYYIISPNMGGIDFYGDLLFCSEDFLKKNPKLVDDFIKASLKGWKYALENQEEIIQLIYNKYSNRHSIDHLRYEALHTVSLILPEVVELGYTNPGRWERIANIYKNLGLINDVDILKGLFYSNYLNKKNNIPWRIILIFSLIVVIILGLFLFFFSLSKKLKQQVEVRIKAESDLRKSQNSLNSLIRNMPGLVYRCKNDSDWTMEYLNDNCYALTGYSSKEILKNSSISFNEIIHPDDREMIRKSVDRGIENNNSFEFTYRIMTKSGEIKWVWEKGNGLHTFDGNLLYLEGIILDINDRKLAEDELKSQRGNLENLVKERTTELELQNEELQRYNNLFVGREFRIKELKERVKELEAQIANNSMVNN